MAASLGARPSEPPGCVLIVEDDVLIRTAAAQHLRGCGLVVLEAVNVEQALDLLGAAKAVRVVFVDVRLPGPQDGLDLMRIVRSKYPDVQLLLTSGVLQTDEATVDGVTFLRKPYFLFEVERHIGSLLSAEAARIAPTAPVVQVQQQMQQQQQQALDDDAGPQTRPPETKPPQKPS
jgi:CheY-like chemotaxis protein